MGLLFVYGLHLLVFQDQAASQSFPSRLFVISGTNDEITCKFIRLPVAHMNFTLLIQAVMVIIANKLLKLTSVIFLYFIPPFIMYNIF